MPRGWKPEDTKSKFLGTVTEYKCREGINSNTLLANKIGMPPSTFNLCMREPDLFRRGQLRKLFTVLHIPKEEWGRLI